MAQQKSIVVGALLIIIGSTSISLAVQTTKTELEGSWEGQKAVVGTKERILKPGEVTMTFTGNKLLARGIVTADEQPLAFKINATASPKQLDYTADGRTRQCLYAIDGDKLTLAVPRLGIRPKAISPDESMTIMIFKRKK
jgi:uncharacterized protein (TIGR03067 family)